MNPALSLPQDPQDIQQRLKQLRNELDHLSRASIQAIMDLGPERRHDDLSNFGIALRSRRAVIQAEYRLLQGGGNAGMPAPHAASAARPPSAAANNNEQRREEATGDEDDDAADEVQDDSDQIIGANDAGWQDVDAFQEGVGKVRLIHRKMEGENAYQSEIGSLRLQRPTTEGKRRLVMRLDNGHLQLNIFAPESHRLEFEKKNNKDFGKIWFSGINGADDRGMEMFVIKCAIGTAQKLSDELGGRTN